MVTSCALTPDYERPDLKLPADWERGEATEESIANTAWWELYDDAVLVELIERALAQNQDLALVLARMEESYYLVNFTRADQFPFLDVFGAAGRGRQSKQINPLANTDSNFGLGANLSFEIDLWRRYARGTRTVVSISVRELPPSESRSRYVSLLLRYGTSAREPSLSANSDENFPRLRTPPSSHRGKRAVSARLCSRCFRRTPRPRRGS